MKEKLVYVAGFPNALVPIKGPSINEHLYVCRKGYRVHHALNMHIQSVADADYKFINIVATWPSIVLTTRSYGAIVIWQLTWSKGKLRVDCWVIVPISIAAVAILTTIVNPVGRPQRRYNSVHCKTRVKIEHMFGIWKSRFRCLHKSGGGGAV